jgi:hypothetical protein
MLEPEPNWMKHDKIQAIVTDGCCEILETLNHLY